MQHSIKSWPLLALCSLFYAMLSLIVLLLLSPDGPPALRIFVPSRNTAGQLGMLALAASICTIAGALASSGRSRSWLLGLNGVACGVLGLILIRSTTRPLAFRTVALLIVLMAVSIGVYELATARTSSGQRADKWLLAGAGAASVGFAAAFLGFVLRWIPLEPSPSGQTFHWLGSFFAFSAICMLGLALRDFRPGAALHRLTNSPLPTA
jgi:uncharacterized membrane protein HdeD (DUF308 family)